MQSCCAWLPAAFKLGETKASKVTADLDAFRGVVKHTVLSTHEVPGPPESRASEMAGDIAVTSTCCMCHHRADCLYVQHPARWHPLGIGAGGPFQEGASLICHQ